MITPVIKAAIITVLGKHYSNSVLEHLSKKGITNTKNEPYTTDNIRLVVNGFRENKTLEAEIIQLANKVKKEQQQLEKEAKKLIK